MTYHIDYVQSWLFIAPSSFWQIMRLQVITLPTFIIIYASTAFSQPLKDFGARGTTLPAAYARAPDTNDVIVARYVANDHTEAQLVQRTDEPVADIMMAWREPTTNKPQPQRLSTLR